MRNILLAVSGLSPQVITETCYALLNQGRRVDEIEVITTRRGQEEIFKNLLAPGAVFQQFCSDFHIDRSSIRFSPETIFTIMDKNGRKLDDINDLDDNEQLLQLCLERSFQHTADSQQAVFFLIAGGRKTMSACLTAAAQFYGRPQDRIYHVLVTPAFESCRDFWYPPPTPVMVSSRTAEGIPCRLSTRDARIQLVAMPFVSMRKYLSPNQLTAPQQPAELLAAMIADAKPLFTVDLREAKLIFGEQEVDVHPTYLALYAWFAARKKECDRKHDCKSCTDCFCDIGTLLAETENVARLYRKIKTARPLAEMSDSGIADLSPENFQSYKSKLKKIIETGLGPTLAADLVIASQGQRPDTRYGINLDKERIRIVL